MAHYKIQVTSPSLVFWSKLLVDCWKYFLISYLMAFFIVYNSFFSPKSCIDSFLGCILAQQTLAAWWLWLWLVAGFANFLANSDSVCKLVNNNPIKIETVRPFTTAFEHHSKQIKAFVCFLFAFMPLNLVLPSQTPIKFSLLHILCFAFDDSKEKVYLFLQQNLYSLIIET